MKRLFAFLLFPALILAQNSTRMLSGVNAQTGTTYTFVAQDATRLVTFANASAIAATLPTGLTLGFGVGTLFSVQNIGAGALTITCSGCFIYSSGAGGSATLVLTQGQGADIYSAGQNYSALVGGAGGGGGGGGCVTNPADGGCSILGSPSVDLFIGSVGGGTGWLFQLLSSALNVKVPLNVASDSNAGRISIACGPDPGTGSNIVIAAPLAGCNPYTVYLPSAAATGFLFGSANGNKLTLASNPSINLQTDVDSTVLPLANGGTNGTSQQQAAINVLPPIGRAGDVIYASAGNWTIFSGCTVSTCIYTENGGGTPGWLNTPIPPLDGGTGLTTLTPNCIYKGNGTAAMLCSSISDNGSAVTVGDKLTSYQGVSLVGNNGFPAEIQAVDLTAQTAAIGTTTLATVATAGQYHLAWNAKVTTAAGTSSTLGALTITYTDPDGVAQTITAGALSKAGAVETTDAGNSTTTVLLGIPLLLNCKAATNIQYAFAYASNAAGAMNYNLHINLEAQ